MNYIRKSVKENNFDIVKCLAFMDYSCKENAEKKFKEIIESIASFQDSRTNKNLKSFALNIKNDNYNVLQKPEVYEYWAEATNIRSVSKRIFAHSLTEEFVSDRSLKSINKRKNMNSDEEEEEEETNNEEADIEDEKFGTNDFVRLHKVLAIKRLKSIKELDGQEISSGSEFASNNFSNSQDSLYSNPVQKFDYLVGPGITDFDLKILDSSSFSAWIVNGNNLSKTFLQYRDYVVRKAKREKLLNIKEEKVLNFIMELSPTEFRPIYLTTDEWSISLLDMQSAYGIVKPDDAFCAPICRFASTAASEIDNAAYFKNCHNVIESMNSLKHHVYHESISNLLRTLIDCYGAVTDTGYMDEESYMPTVVEPCLRVFFKEENNLSIAGSSSVCSSSKSARQSFDPSLVGKKPDYAISCNIENKKYDILFLEAKSTTSNLKQNDRDEVKLANLMKNSIDTIINDGLDNDNLLVTGLTVQGDRCDLHVMDLCYDSIYRSYNCLTFYFPKTKYDFYRVPSLVQGLLTAKSFVEKTSNSLQSKARGIILSSMSPRRSSSNQQQPSFLSPIKLPPK